MAILNPFSPKTKKKKKKIFGQVIAPFYWSPPSGENLPQNNSG
jgi:hypothetical protein